MELKFRLKRAVQVALLTVSDTRTKAHNPGGQLLWQLAEASGMVVVATEIVRDDVPLIRSVVAQWLSDREVDAIITTGGTGIAKRDCTIEALRPLLEKEVEGFGELFRFLSYTEDVGTRAMLSRALAGVAQDTVIFALPGSLGAVRLGMERLVIPEVQHFVYEATKHLRE